MDFLNYAREHNIQILCYPSHATHVYQGLDVVIFSPLKRRWSEERQAFEGSKRQRVSKRNFVTIYGRAHRHVLTQDLVRTAFKKTGVWPFNANLVTKQMMAPSLETSSQGHLPLPQPSPVRAIASWDTHSRVFSCKKCCGSTPGITSLHIHRCKTSYVQHTPVKRNTKQIYTACSQLLSYSQYTVTGCQSSSDEFYQRVVDHENTTAAQKLAQENRRKQKEEQTHLMTAWREASKTCTLD